MILDDPANQADVTPSHKPTSNQQIYWNFNST